MQKLEVLSTIPRCTCQSFADFVVVNKKTGEKKYFCQNCGKLHLLNYSNGNYEIQKLM